MTACTLAWFAAFVLKGIGGFVGVWICEDEGGKKGWFGVAILLRKI